MWSDCHRGVKAAMRYLWQTQRTLAYRGFEPAPPSSFQVPALLLGAGTFRWGQFDGICNWPLDRLHAIFDYFFEDWG